MADENLYRVRAERGEVQIGTWVTIAAAAMLTDTVEGVRQMIDLGATIINYSSDASVLRSSYAAVVDELRRAGVARA